MDDQLTPEMRAKLQAMQDQVVAEIAVWQAEAEVIGEYKPGVTEQHVAEVARRMGLLVTGVRTEGEYVTVEWEEPRGHG